MTDRPATARNVSAAKGAGRSLLLNAVCSLLISATTCFIFIHYSLVPLAANKAHPASAALRIATPAKPDNAPAPAEEKSSDGLSQPKVAADIALQAVGPILLDKGYIGVQAHASLKTDLTQMKAAAEAILNDNGKDNDASSKENAALAKAIDEAIARTAIYISRSSEKGQSRDTTQQLHDLLVELKAQ